MKTRIDTKTNTGITLVEIVIGAAIISVGIIAAITAYTTYVQYALANQNNTVAAYLGEEGIESVAFLRDKGWNSNIALLSTTSTYYLSWNNSTWNLTTTAQPYIDGTYLRAVSISDVKRDGSDNIASSGTYDANTKKVTVTISYYLQHGTTTQTFSSYITNLWSN